MANPLSSYVLSLEPTFDVLSAYASSNATLAATASDAWIAIGGFRVPSALIARLQVIGLAATGCTLKVAIFGPRRIANSQVTILASSDTKVDSISFSLDGQTNYIIAASCTANAVADTAFGVIRTASLTAP